MRHFRTALFSIKVSITAMPCRSLFSLKNSLSSFHFQSQVHEWEQLSCQKDSYLLSGRMQEQAMLWVKQVRLSHENITFSNRPWSWRLLQINWDEYIFFLLYIIFLVVLQFHNLGTKQRNLWSGMREHIPVKPEELKTFQIWYSRKPKMYKVNLTLSLLKSQ